MTDTATDTVGTTKDVHPPLQKAVASFAAQASLGPLADFIAERSGVDYMLFISSNDFRRLAKEELKPFDADASQSEEENRRKAREIITGFGKSSLDPEVLRAVPGFDSMSAERQDDLLALVSAEEYKRQMTFRHFVSPAHAAVVRLPSGQTLGLIGFDLDLYGENMDKVSRGEGRGARSSNPVSSDRRDQSAYALFHELGHIRHRTFGGAPIFELDALRSPSKKDHEDVYRYGETVADRDGFSLYREAHHLGLVSLSPDEMKDRITGQRFSTTFASFRYDQSLPRHSTDVAIIADKNAAILTPLKPEHDAAFQRFMMKLDGQITANLLDDRLSLKHGRDVDQNYPNFPGHVSFCHDYMITNTLPGEFREHILDTMDDRERQKLGREFAKCIRDARKPHDLLNALTDMGPQLDDSGLEGRFRDRALETAMARHEREVTGRELKKLEAAQTLAGVGPMPEPP